ncbi:MAG TPA: methylmalonyl Co-A mutase-associated GTPase MeaB [Bryobacteraceae bacterium]|nr:methylmalonyl Co-A mutase-associated GTPase MeaB [Bryobacteraceae bacterium]HOQ45738.1 methylmalonyl Co-A mutase-associated GTPase MeaB [Bryobacteraceae bacterium]HPQ15510.1 methylmalonyl Co-A mutase-associated GTPase MeaB [Bryobacteraceae bacterium]HPU71535.1 methylmalonyl Co-A mutase-associated GTPase MeaB [Bryobacteraceae bacterium]
MEKQTAVRAGRRRLSAQEYVEGILKGDRIALARAITIIESRRADDAELAQEILDACLPHTGRAVRVGITGAPGAGKSTFIEALGKHLTRERKEKVAVLAVDPSSRISRGSILGDKTRMSSLAGDPLAFIRPSPSGGSLGGVARRTRETILLCEAAGFPNVIVETVGVGQSETAVRGMVDFFLLLLLPNAGDELQGLKRGVMELCDLIAINKADTDRHRASIALHECRSALHLFAAQPWGWTPRAVLCSAVTGEGIAEIWEAVLEHRRLLEDRGLLQQLRQEQSRAWLHDMIEEALLNLFREHPLVRQKLPELERQVAEGRLSAFHAAERLLAYYQKDRIP